jgi:hypothetical protein
MKTGVRCQVSGVRRSVVCCLLSVVCSLWSVVSLASTNVTPATGMSVPMAATSLVIRAAILESNALARVNPSVLVAAPVLTNLTTLTNAGWSTTGTIATNGLILDNGEYLLSPALGSGLSAIEYSSSASNLTTVLEWSTNLTTWTTLASTSDLRNAWSSWYFRLSATNAAPPPPGNYYRIQTLSLLGHQRPDLIGVTNDFAGIVIRVDNPVGSRDAVNLQTLNSRLAAFVPGGSSGSSWSLYPASNTVDLAGHALQLDPRYVVSVSGDTVALTFGGAPVFEITGAATSTPRIARFRVSGTNLSADVVGVIGWRPYPQWSTDLVAGAWTTLSTNAFTSTYPAVTNGLFTLAWNSLGYTTEYWRIIALDETGGTNGTGLALFHVPVNVPALTVNGVPIVPGESTVSNAVHALEADHAATAGYATNSGAATTAGYATNSGSATTAGYATSAGTSSYATNAGTAVSANSAAVAIYANTAGSATTAGNATTANSATTATYATTAGYATNAGYATSAGYAPPPNWLINNVSNCILIGTSARGTTNSIALGTSASSGVDSISIGHGALASNGLQNTMIAIGDNAAATNSGSVSIGHITQSAGVASIAIGGLARAGMHAVALGVSNTAEKNAISIGYGTYAVATNAIAIGADAYASDAGAVQIGAGTNSAANSLQVRDYQLLTSGGKIPNARHEGWSGVWTNVLGGITNLLQFSNGTATNMLTL